MLVMTCKCARTTSGDTSVMFVVHRQSCELLQVVFPLGTEFPALNQIGCCPQLVASPFANHELHVYTVQNSRAYLRHFLTPSLSIICAIVISRQKLSTVYPSGASLLELSCEAAELTINFGQATVPRPSLWWLLLVWLPGQCPSSTRLQYGQSAPRSS